MIRTISLQVPSDISEKEVRLLVAGELYKGGKLTLKQAADLSNLSLWDLLHEFGKRNVSFTNITIDDLKKEIEGLE